MCSVKQVLLKVENTQYKNAIKKAMYIGKYLRWDLFLVKLLVFSMQLYQKRDFGADFLPVNFAKYLRNDCSWKVPEFQ